MMHIFPQVFWKFKQPIDQSTYSILELMYAIPLTLPAGPMWMLVVVVAVVVVVVVVRNTFSNHISTHCNILISLFQQLGAN